MLAKVVMSLAAQELAHSIGPRLLVRTLAWCLEPRENSNELDVYQGQSKEKD